MVSLQPTIKRRVSPDCTFFRSEFTERQRTRYVCLCRKKEGQLHSFIEIRSLMNLTTVQPVTVFCLDHWNEKRKLTKQVRSSLHWNHRKTLPINKAIPIVNLVVQVITRISDLLPTQLRPSSDLVTLEQLREIAREHTNPHHIALQLQ